MALVNWGQNFEQKSVRISLESADFVTYLSRFGICLLVKQFLVLLFSRDHHLQNWFKLLHESNVTNQMYEQNSFFREGTLLNFLIEVLEALREFNITLDKSITRGI